MMEVNRRAGRQKLANFKVIFDLFIFCFYFIQQHKYKLYYVTLMIISEFQSIGNNIQLLTNEALDMM